MDTLWNRPGSHAFWPGFDLVLASIISWTPLVADYTRFSRTDSAGFWAGLGYFVPTIPLFGLGAVIAMSRQIGDAPGLLTAIAAGGAASVLALLALTVDESDEAFANVYSGAVSLQNLMPRVPQRILVAGTAAVATIGALLIDLRNYQPFLFLLGSFFVPLFGVLLADWLLAGRHYTRADIFDAPAVRVLPIAAWLAGFCALPVARAGRPRVVDGARGPHRPPLAALGGRLAPELRARIRPHLCHRPARAQARTGARVIALLGNLSRDLMEGGSRTGGGPFHAARALKHLDVPALIYARCAEADREELLPPLAALGTPVRYVPGESTSSFGISYEGLHRHMEVVSVGDVWLPSDLPALPDEVSSCTSPRSRAATSRPRPWPPRRADDGSRSTARASSARPARAGSCWTPTSIPSFSATSGC